MEHLTIEEYERVFMHGIESESIIKYFDDAVSIAIKPYFHMKKTDKSHFWFGDWANPCHLLSHGMESILDKSISACQTKSNG